MGVFVGLGVDMPDRAFSAGLEVAGNTDFAWGPVGFKFESALRYLFPIAAVPVDDRDRLGLVWIIDGKAEIGIVGGLSASALVNFTMANAMITQDKIYTTTVVGLALSYGDRFKWLF